MLILYLRYTFDPNKRAAYEAFRKMLEERHEAIREREAALRRSGANDSP